MVKSKAATAIEAPKKPAATNRPVSEVGLGLYQGGTNVPMALDLSNIRYKIIPRATSARYSMSFLSKEHYIEVEWRWVIPVRCKWTKGS